MVRVLESFTYGGKILKKRKVGLSCWFQSGRLPYFQLPVGKGDISVRTDFPDKNHGQCYSPWNSHAPLYGVGLCVWALGAGSLCASAWCERVVWAVPVGKSMCFPRRYMPHVHVPMLGPFSQKEPHRPTRFAYIVLFTPRHSCAGVGFLSPPLRERGRGAEMKGPSSGATRWPPGTWLQL